MIKSLAFLEIVGKQFGRRQDFFILFRELAQVEVAIGGDKVFNRIATRFLVTISNNNLLTQVLIILCRNVRKRLLCKDFSTAYTMLLREIGRAHV